jgi:hypothetical protein
MEERLINVFETLKMYYNDRHEMRERKNTFWRSLSSLKKMFLNRDYFGMPIDYIIFCRGY